MDTIQLDWGWFDRGCVALAKELEARRLKLENIYGLPRGGLVPAVALSHLLDLPIITNEADIRSTTLVVDDICDSGQTLRRLERKNNVAGLATTVTLVRNTGGDYLPVLWCKDKKPDQWVIFPWEVGPEEDTVSKVLPA